jgi:hypothetical protein
MALNGVASVAHHAATRAICNEDNQVSRLPTQLCTRGATLVAAIALVSCGGGGGSGAAANPL